jgi:hypothetical protein
MSLIFTDQQVEQLWPAARAELLSLAILLNGGPGKLQASQLCMAIQLADKSFKRHKKKHPAPENKMMRPAPENKHA